MSLVRLFVPAILALTLVTASAVEPADATFTGKLSADSSLLSAAGTQVQGPRDWTVRRDPQALVLVSPEGDLRAAVIDLKAADAAAAVREAWARYRPDEKHAVRVATPRSARNGWDERKVFDYDTSPNERLALTAMAMRRGADWTVLLIDPSLTTTVTWRSVVFGVSLVLL